MTHQCTLLRMCSAHLVGGRSLCPHPLPCARHPHALSSLLRAAVPGGDGHLWGPYTPPSPRCLCNQGGRGLAPRELEVAYRKTQKSSAVYPAQILGPRDPASQARTSISGVLWELCFPCVVHVGGRGERQRQRVGKRAPPPLFFCFSFGPRPALLGWGEREGEVSHPAP